MAILGLVEYEEAAPEARAVFDDIMETRGTRQVNNFWKALACDPVTMRRTWESIKQVMAPGALDPLTKELIYVAVSASNQCGYCIASHTASARKKGMTDAMFQELMAVVGMASETNRLASGYQVEIDEAFTQSPVLTAPVKRELPRPGEALHPPRHPPGGTVEAAAKLPDTAAAPAEPAATKPRKAGTRGRP
jgi:AhpD family alkylhydroperoxidase